MRNEGSCFDVDAVFFFFFLLVFRCLVCGQRIFCGRGDSFDVCGHLRGITFAGRHDGCMWKRIAIRLKNYIIEGGVGIRTKANPVKVDKVNAKWERLASNSRESLFTKSPNPMSITLHEWVIEA